MVEHRDRSRIAFAGFWFFTVALMRFLVVQLTGRKGTLLSFLFPCAVICNLGQVGGLEHPGNLEELLGGDWALVEVAISRHPGILPTWHLSFLGGRSAH